MKGFIVTIVIALAFFYLIPRIGGFASAAFLKFDKSTLSVNQGDTFTIGVMVDAGSDQILSIDAYVLFNPLLVDAQFVQAENFFPTVTNDIKPGKVYIAGLVDDPATLRTGSGLVAAITFKALAPGTATLSYDCQEGADITSKVIKNDINATNIIVCAENTSSTIAVAGGGQINNTPVPATTTQTQLPQTGIFDNIVRVAVPGMVLLIIGGALRIFLKT